MNVRDRIERAEKALRTGQPNLALTYMKSASDQIWQQRQDRAKSPEFKVLLIGLKNMVDFADAVHAATVPTVADLRAALDISHCFRYATLEGDPR